MKPASRAAAPTTIATIALLGGVYANHLALLRALQDAKARGAGRIYCLGDLGAFGPNPDKVFPLLLDYGVETIQGNYDHSIGNRREDCACGYTDPRDNYFARRSYEYTFKKTSDRWKDWMRGLPAGLTIELAGRAIHLCHGSPRQTNEFLWETATSDAFLGKLFQLTGTDAIACTHTGLHWQREVGGRLFMNVGTIGRPENDGRTSVGYMLVTSDRAARAGLRAEYISLDYDHAALAAEMRAEKLPSEFIDTIETGWWTCCLEILPGKERARGKY